jgi:succinate-semialdehyde dehydrogenase / glutarate-semialdehyde dehydrogenase
MDANPLFRSLPVRNPRTGEIDAHIEPVEDVAGLAARLRDAQPAWARMPMSARIEVLLAFGRALSEATPAIAAALEIDTGRRALAIAEVRSVGAMIARWAATAADLVGAHADRSGPTSLPGVSYATQLHPFPLVGAISTWSFPLTLSMVDAVPALVAGCAVIVKPSEIAPRFIRPLMDAVRHVPALASVFAVIEGDGTTGAALVDTVDYIAFTGSVATGRTVATAAAAALIPASLELGGKDPMIVLESADPVAAAQIALRASVVATGQACQSIERVYVAQEIYGEFLAALVAAAYAVAINQPDIARGDIGPFISASQAAIVAAQIADAKANGARVLTGGVIETRGGGLYMRPTVVADVTHDMALMRSETLGPVIPVMRFATVDDAVMLANDSPFGLSAAVIAKTVAAAEAVAVRLNAGTVSINDGALTHLVSDHERTGWGASGLGPSRTGQSGLLRFLRVQALLRQNGTPLPLSAFGERPG